MCTRFLRISSVGLGIEIVKSRRHKLELVLRCITLSSPANWLQRTLSLRLFWPLQNSLTSFTIKLCDPVNLYLWTVLLNLRNYDHCLGILTQINEAIEATKLQPLPQDHMEQQTVSKEACKCLNAAISQELISYIKNANYWLDRKPEW